MITEDYVSFKTAKLLKEKGFDEPCALTEFDTDAYKKWMETAPKPIMLNAESEKPFRYSIPSIYVAMKWLRENFNMNPVPYATSIGWYFEVFDLTQRDVTGCALLYQVGIPSKEKTFKTCEEACEAGIRYCLENLI